MNPIKKLTTLFLLATIGTGISFAQEIKGGSPHSDVHKRLLANQNKKTDQIQFVEKNTFIDLIDDDIEPEIDI